MSETIAVDAAVSSEKRGKLSGGALTDEALDSSRSVLSAQRGAGLRGLQQFYTPPEAAGLIKGVLDPHGRFSVLDPTAGDGALLAPWPAAQRFGIEIDADQVKRGDYHAIAGDLQIAFPMLKRLGVSFERIAANPPFGLQWTDGAGAPVNSARATWRMCLALLAGHGAGAFICGRDRFRREILTREDAAGVFATVECPDLFDGVELPCLIAFFLSSENRAEGSVGLLVEASCSRAELGDTGLSSEIANSLVAAPDYVSRSPVPGCYAVEALKLVDEELARRRREAARGAPTYDIELRAGDRLHVRPSPLTRHALARAGKLKLLQTLHNQPAGHFALNALDWRMVAELERDLGLTVSPTLKEAVERVGAEAEREVIPLYEVRPQMRLGYLTDLDAILCTASDPNRGFEAGTRYPLATRSEIAVTTGEKVARNKDGEPVVRKYEEEAKVLVIEVAEHKFSESAQDISYILDHFEVPNPGDIATRFPEQVERQREVLDAIAARARAKASREFAFKRFQREDLARALTKTKDGGGFILSWEQGGGKTIGAAAYALGAVRNGAKNRVLFIVPQDLIPQYRR
ncbi:MAG: hypothetical protein ACYDC2_10520, partial [Solirubrobacteraceae bacterium]